MFSKDVSKEHPSPTPAPVPLPQLPDVEKMLPKRPRSSKAQDDGNLGCERELDRIEQGLKELLEPRLVLDGDNFDIDGVLDRMKRNLDEIGRS